MGDQVGAARRIWPITRTTVPLMTGSMYASASGVPTLSPWARVVGTWERRELLAQPDRAHMVQFYRDDSALLDAVGAYLLAGLVAGEPIVVIATAEHRVSFLALLADRGFDVERAGQSGWLTMLDARDTLESFLVDGGPDRARFAAVVGGVFERVRARHGGRPLRAYGEMVNLLWQGGEPHAALALETLWNELAARDAFSLFCAYGMENFSGSDSATEITAVCSVHSHVLPITGEREVPSAAVWPDGTGPMLRAPASHDADDRLTAALRDALAAQAAAALENARLCEVARNAHVEADEANRVKDDFLAMLGHELRNPLSPILTAVQLMKLRGDPASAREREIIERQVHHLIHLVDDLLDVSRVTEGKLQLDRKPVRVAALIARAVEHASPQLEERSHRLDVIVPDAREHQGVDQREDQRTVELWVEGDELRLCQVLTHLLSNAAKFTEGPGHITVSAERVDGDVVIRVRDDGIGIAPELLPRVFDLFVRGSRRVRPSQGGLGIGLTLVHRLVAMHNGQVTAHSAGPGRGSEFVVRLPAREAPTAEPTASEDVRRPPVRKATGRRVLVVDDNQDAAALLGEMLQSLGHVVEIANDGPRALELVARFRPEIAILDIGLPVMDGYELAGLLRGRLGAELRMMAVTGYGQERDRVRARAAGFDAHFVKPVPFAMLLAAIDHVSQPSS